MINLLSLGNDDANIVAGEDSKLFLAYSITDQGTIDALTAAGKDVDVETTYAAAGKDVFTKVYDPDYDTPVYEYERNYRRESPTAGTRITSKLLYHIKPNSVADLKGTGKAADFLPEGFEFAADSAQRTDIVATVFTADIGAVATAPTPEPIPPEPAPEVVTLFNEWQQPYRYNLNYTCQSNYDTDVVQALDSRAGTYANDDFRIAAGAVLPVRDAAAAVDEPFAALELDGLGGDFLDRNCAFQDDFDRALGRLVGAAE